MHRRIDEWAPELQTIIFVSEPINILAEGLGGPKGPAEGPVWWHAGGYLLFSDNHRDRRMKYQPGAGLSVDREGTNHANGLAFSPDGTVLYIDDSRRGHIRAFDVAPSGTLARSTDRVFADLLGEEPGVPVPKR